jgi:hypothetical protein
MLKHYLLEALILLNSFSLLAQQRSFEETVAAYFNEIKAVTAEHKDVWDYDLYAPILLVHPDTRQVYANVPDTAGALRQDGMIFTGTLPAQVNIANTATTWNGVHWAMFMLPLPENRTDRLNLLAHELFHRAQPDLGFTLYNAENNHLDQKEGRVTLRLELEALRAAVLARSHQEKMKALSDALLFRSFRHAVFPKADSTENMLELNEGLAEYTGVMMSGRDTQQMRDHVVETMNSFLTNPTFVRSFAYQTIPLYGYLLQSSNEGWNKHITSGTSLTAYFMKAFNVQLPGDMKSVIMESAIPYGGQNIIAEETEREAATGELIAQYTSTFVELPHLNIPLRNMNVSFDPRNIMPLEDKGTVYPNIRITDDWGILTVTKGALLSPTWNSVAVTIPIRIGEEEVLGDGWTLELKPDFVVQKEDAGDNFVLRKR